MYKYNIIQWVFFFYFYCFFGWVFESCVVSVKNRKFVNRGFMRGPFLPLYGSGAIMMLVVSMPFQEHLLLVYLSGCIGATILEYITGVTMEALFKVRYWDYSDQKFNFQGQICLSSSLAWGGLTILMTRFVHKPVEQLVLGIPITALTCITLGLTVWIVSDFALSFRAAMDLRDILAKMEAAREELRKVSRRLDVILAVAEDNREMRKQEREEQMDELKNNLEERFEKVKEKLAGGSEYLEGIKEELFELRDKYRFNLETGKQLKSLKDFYKRGMLRGNPGMVSKRFKEALEELKEAADRKKK